MLLGSLWAYGKSRLSTRRAGLSPTSQPIECIAESSSQTPPLVTIIIPTRDKADLLDSCIQSIKEKTAYANFEILVVDNQSRERASLELFSKLKAEGVRLLSFDQRFNYAAISNLAVNHANGDYICLLNNDTEVISGNWLGSMMSHATKASTGFVGSILLSPAGAIQHAGLALGFAGIAEHAYAGQEMNQVEPQEAVSTCHAVEAVTFACALIGTEKYLALGGLDEDFAIGLNDVDACIRASRSGLTNVLCAKAVLTHVESATRPKALSARGAFGAFSEVRKFLAKHHFGSLGDRYHLEAS
jgi:GT2 family glycosyltransferase